MQIIVRISIIEIFYVGYILILVTWTTRSTWPTSKRSKKWIRSSSTLSRSWSGCQIKILNKIEIWKQFCSRTFYKELCYIKCYKCSYQSLNNWSLQKMYVEERELPIGCSKSVEDLVASVWWRWMLTIRRASRNTAMNK